MQPHVAVSALTSRLEALVITDVLEIVLFGLPLLASNAVVLSPIKADRLVVYHEAFNENLEQSSSSSSEVKRVAHLFRFAGPLTSCTYFEFFVLTTFCNMFPFTSHYPGMWFLSENISLLVSKHPKVLSYSTH